ncbi:MAG: 16S rRNA (guanine(527)-N(7))-methyltransferase RsmG [Pseudobdellovibrionaceae bacterium]
MNNSNNNSEQQAPTIFWRIDEWFPALSPEIKSRLKIYHDELLKNNRTVNLISAKTLFVADALHFADSILGSQTIQRCNPTLDKIYDLGSGSGFPGLIFAILYPKIQVHLIESDSKKCEFLNHIKQELKINNAVVENRTIESIADGSVRFAMVRGLSTLSKVMLLTRKSIVKGGVLYHLKGEEWGVEIAEIPSQLCSIWTPALAGEYKLPVGAVKFSVIKTDKIA